MSTCLAPGHRPAATIADLTRRQAQVARLVAVGLTQKEIAYRLSISAQTVKNHVTAVLGRTGCEGHVALARWVWVQECPCGRRPT